MLFLLYRPTADLVLQLVESFGLYLPLYADNTQIYGFCRPGATRNLLNRVADCVAAVAGWMQSNRLQLNAPKTGVLVCASARRQSQLYPPTRSLLASIYCRCRLPARSQYFYTDAGLTMRMQIVQTCSK